MTMVWRCLSPLSWGAKLLGEYRLKKQNRHRMLVEGGGHKEQTKGNEFLLAHIFFFKSCMYSNQASYPGIINPEHSPHDYIN